MTDTINVPRELLGRIAELESQLNDPDYPPKYSRRLIAELREELTALKAQVKGLVEALEAVEQEHILRSRMQDCVLRRNGETFGIAVHSDKHAIEWQALGKELDAMIARRDEALATYRAAQEWK